MGVGESGKMAAAAAERASRVESSSTAATAVVSKARLVQLRKWRFFV